MVPYAISRMKHPGSKDVLSDMVEKNCFRHVHHQPHLAAVQNQAAPNHRRININEDKVSRGSANSVLVRAIQ